MFGQVVLELVERSGEIKGDLAGSDGRSNVARDADQTDDLPGGITDRQLRREAPSRLVWGGPMQFKVVQERAASLQHGLVLGGRNAAKFTGTNFGGPLAEHLGFVAQTVPLDEGTVNHQVPSGRILDEEHHVRRLVEEAFQEGDVHRRRYARNRCGELRQWAGFHGWMTFNSKTDDESKGNFYLKTMLSSCTSAK